MKVIDCRKLLRHIFSGPHLVQKYFPPAALAEIEEATRLSEKQHSGQVRFAVEPALSLQQLWQGLSARDRAAEVFAHLRIWDTEHNNGVLIYLLLADRQIEIVADRGINAKCAGSLWPPVCRRIEQHFKDGSFKAGILTGIGLITAALAAHFPPDQTAVNELNDQPVVL